MTALALLSLAALHDVHGSGGFLSGVMHPLTGLDHLVAMVAVGLWGAQLGRPASIWLPVAFPLVMACGAFVALAGAPLPYVEVGVAASAVLLGLAVACEWRPKIAVALACVAVFAVFHGYAHGAELPEGEDGLRYSLGFVLATGGLHAVGIAIGLIHRFDRGRVVLRALGVVVAVVGAWFLWGTVA